ncbi:MULTISPECIES: pyocin knob domain-containing protein [unclassified Clostridium]|uniref:pyocin knob domain-containing protein n=1 Tax=unclassified Clostridium TaxID=2614128 RepID=UPI0002982D3A|nr:MULTISPECIES: pyocin knob domain-containing protein [unclassified Clostridium]EKQ51386.1 MAG: hypothetical protein A370_04913 [Clostridium sp. Maddingley MBC34-26]
MLTTPNYGLKKPEGTDVVNIDDFNGNADIIDTKLKDINTALPLKAPLDSPAFTGAPTVPTQASTDNSTKAANTAFVTTAVSNKTSVSGNAGTATKWQTARTLSLTGDVTGSATIDGSANVSITATIEDDSHNHVVSNIDGLQASLDTINSSKANKDGVLQTNLNADMLDNKHSTDFFPQANTMGGISGLNLDTAIVNGFQHGWHCTGTLPSGYATDNDFYVLAPWDGNGDWQRQIIFDVRSNNIFQRAKLGGTWSSWSQIATIDTTIIDLPLNSGYTNSDINWKCKLIKCGKMILCEICVKKTDGSNFAAGTQIQLATLPSGYETAVNLNFVLSNSSNAMVGGSIAYSNVIYITPSTSCSSISGSFCYFTN